LSIVIKNYSGVSDKLIGLKEHMTMQISSTVGRLEPIHHSDNTTSVHLSYWLFCLRCLLEINLKIRCSDLK